MMTISIGKADAECPDKVTLTSGMVNAVQIVFSFSEHWDEFDNKIAVFSNGTTTLDVPLDGESKCFVPHEVLKQAGKEVSVGVYGSKGEGSEYVAIPTEKCSLGKVVEGVNPSGEEPTEPTPTVLDELVIRVGNLDRIITSNDDSVTINGSEFLYISSEDTMSLSTRNAMHLESDMDMNLRATDINIEGNMHVQAPKSDDSVVTKKYVDDAVRNAGGGGGGSSDSVITSDDMGVSLDGKDFLDITSGDSMSFSTRNSMNISSESDMYISASSIDVTGDMTVQAPQNDSSVATKKYVDDAIATLRSLLNI